MIYGSAEGSLHWCIRKDNHQKPLQWLERSAGTLSPKTSALETTLMNYGTLPILLLRPRIHHSPIYATGYREVSSQSHKTFTCWTGECYPSIDGLCVPGKDGGVVAFAVRHRTPRPHRLSTVIGLRNTAPLCLICGSQPVRNSRIATYGV